MRSIEKSHVHPIAPSSERGRLSCTEWDPSTDVTLYTSVHAKIGVIVSTFQALKEKKLYQKLSGGRGASNRGYSPVTRPEREEHNIVLLGETGVGKSSLTIRFTLDTFIEMYDNTIEDSYRKLRTIDGIETQLDILDTAWRFEYRSDSYIRERKGVMVVYDICDRKSFEAARVLYEQVGRRNGDSGPEGMKQVVVLVGNKSDREAECVVEKSEAWQVVKENGDWYYETSAKENVGVKEAFSGLVRRIRREVTQ